MAIYLYLLNKLIHQNKWKLFFTISFPFFLLFIIFPFVSKTVEESEVPIAFVNGVDSELAKTVTQRVDDYPRINLITMSNVDAETAVMTGEVEAAFILNEHLENNIKGGELENQITWIRSENSFLDAFVKEKIAAEIMRFALNSKAANDLQYLTKNTSLEDWQQAFNHSEAYWEPEPLFQMKFVPYSNSDTTLATEDELNQFSLGLLGFWLFYIWVSFSISLLPLYTWQEKGILTRVQLVRGNLTRFYSSFYFLNILFMALIFIAIILAQDYMKLDKNITYLQLLKITLPIVAVIFLISILLQRLLSKSQLYFMIVLIYGLSSFTFSIFYLFSNTDKWWYDLLPHVWLYQLIQ